MTDWSQEASQMCDIYNNSTLPIATPIALDSTESIIQKRKASKLLSDSSGAGTVSTIVTGSNTNYGMWTTSNLVPADLFLHFFGWEFFNLERVTAKPPWLGQAWTYQEWMLSPRVLHMHDMTLWDCSGGYGNELSHRSLTPTNIIRDPDHLGNKTSWKDGITEFTARGIGKGTDRLPALAGLAHRHAQKTGQTYLAGLWVENFPFELL